MFSMLATVYGSIVFKEKKMCIHILKSEDITFW